MSMNDRNSQVQNIGYFISKDQFTMNSCGE